MTDTAPQFRIQLTHPNSSHEDAESRRAVLRVEETVSSQMVFELELSSADLHDLLSQRFAYPSIRMVGPHPERWGREMQLTTATYAHRDAALDAKAALEAGGWQVDMLKRNNAHRWVVTGRRWDGRG